MCVFNLIDYLTQIDSLKMQIEVAQDNKIIETSNGFLNVS